MLDVMVDLETMGRGPGCAIVAIGAVQFDLRKGEIGDQFYATIDLESCVKQGLTLDPDTIMWWMGQGDEARKALTRNTMPLPIALDAFTLFLQGCGALNEIKVWGNGPSFDNAILSRAYEVCGIEQPWKFWNDRCFRTLRAMFPSVEPDKREGVHHNALDDALYQVEHLIKIGNARKQRRTEAA